MSKNSENDVLFEQIANLIHKYVGVSKSKISLSSNLSNDLGFDGDDADEFMIEFAEDYNVNMSNYDFSKYFEPEGFPLYAPFTMFVGIFYEFYRRIFSPDSKSFEQKFGKLEPITVQDLVDAAKAGKWQKA